MIRCFFGKRGGEGNKRTRLGFTIGSMPNPGPVLDFALAQFHCAAISHGPYLSEKDGS